MVDIFAWQIDFFRINPGDNYEIFYTEEIIDSVVVGISNVKAARFTHNEKDFYAFSYNQGLGNDYFDENGKSLRKTFLRSLIKSVDTGANGTQDYIVKKGSGKDKIAKTRQ